MVIASNSMNNQTIDKFSIPRGSVLEYLCIGENCFQNVKSVILQDAHNLITLIIRKNSFNKMNGSFTCAKCSNLEELIIEKGCFTQYSEISLFSNSINQQLVYFLWLVLPNLNIMQFGDAEEQSNNFSKVTSFAIHSKNVFSCK